MPMLVVIVPLRTRLRKTRGSGLPAWRRLLIACGCAKPLPRPPKDLTAVQAAAVAAAPRTHLVLRLDAELHEFTAARQAELLLRLAAFCSVPIEQLYVLSKRAGSVVLTIALLPPVDQVGDEYDEYDDEYDAFTPFADVMNEPPPPAATRAERGGADQAARRARLAALFETQRASFTKAVGDATVEQLSKELGQSVLSASVAATTSTEKGDGSVFDAADSAKQYSASAAAAAAAAAERARRAARTPAEEVAALQRELDLAKRAAARAERYAAEVDRRNAALQSEMAHDVPRADGSISPETATSRSQPPRSLAPSRADAAAAAAAISGVDGAAGGPLTAIGASSEDATAEVARAIYGASAMLSHANTQAVEAERTAARLEAQLGK